MYSVDKLKDALDSIHKGLTLREAADKFGVPKSTLHRKLKPGTSIDCRKGPSTVLSNEEEEEIVRWILYSAERGFPVSKSTLLNCVQHFLMKNNRNTPFTNKKPGKHWYLAFMRRHPNLSKRIAQNLTCTRASVTEEDLRKWFGYIEKKLIEKNLLSLESHRIYNLDESAFMMVPKDNSVIAEKGSRSVYQITGNEKACLTVLFTASASGLMAPPMLLFSLKKPPTKKILEAIPTDWGVGHSERGWMTADTFYNFLKNVFFKWLVKENIEIPVILYVDGHSSHLTLPVVQFCEEKKIELIALYPNATHIIQPLDVTIFRPLKEHYAKTLREWRIEHNIVNVQKHMFAPVLKKALDSIDLSGGLKNGFQACGLFPFNANAVNYNILNKGKKKSTKE